MRPKYGPALPDCLVRYFSPLGIVIGFVIGGVTGIWLNIIPIDIVVHDTAFVVGHFHMIIIGGAVTALLGALYNYFPEITGKMYHRGLAWIHCFGWIGGVFITFNAMMIAGLIGMPRRYFDYSTFETVELFAFWNLLATIGAFIMAFSILAMIINFVYSIRRGPPAGDDPFGLNIEESPSIEAKVTQ